MTKPQELVVLGGRPELVEAREVQVVKGPWSAGAVSGEPDVEPEMEAEMATRALYKGRQWTPYEKHGTTLR